ncbi:hypothetical protein jhhlp_003698 [Lomentospora prolificans]|uniref:Fe2OG dioxygenase domain-containing protein n=1 Tax=Lomentospora prolificans TaxID=41688 RepID=A0A2N3N9K0_9PEZI|nr:hypothetical protein jhhlp_003698 [Lomentospora prolificans]
MDAFITRKRKSNGEPEAFGGVEDEPTDVKLTILSSLYPNIEQETLLDVLIAHNGSVTEASDVLKSQTPAKKLNSALAYQPSLRHFAQAKGEDGQLLPAKKRLISKRGATMHLYDPLDVAEHTPCTIIHNFLPAEVANGLLRELLDEAESFEKISFKLFENVVSSPHTSGFFVESYDEIQEQKTAYLYNGARLSVRDLCLAVGQHFESVLTISRQDVRRLTPYLLKVKPIVQEAVNREIESRIRTKYPNGQKLKFQSAKPWVPNAAFVNCYNGPKESVGWHSDQLTYLGPRSVIGSISLGVSREFRVRRVLPKDSGKDNADNPDAEGQISIHLPHNSLLVMHAEMQEEWKHCVSPATSVEPHPIAGNKRINITYRYYRDSMHPKLTPRCKCGIPCVLRVVQRKKENYGKYFWMCHAGNVPGKQSCPFFEWAQFDNDGNPLSTAHCQSQKKETPSDAGTCT